MSLRFLQTDHAISSRDVVKEMFMISLVWQFVQSICFTNNLVSRSSDIGSEPKVTTRAAAGGIENFQSGKCPPPQIRERDAVTFVSKQHTRYKEATAAPAPDNEEGE